MHTEKEVAAAENNDNRQNWYWHEMLNSEWLADGK